MTASHSPRRVVAWGTFDLGKPRVRILLEGLRQNGVDVVLCHKDVWGGVEDKSQIKGAGQRLRFLLKWLLAYPSLLYRYWRLPAHDAVLISYMGHLDVLVIWLFAKLRGKPIIWDAFLSLYNTVVEDRELIKPANPAAKLLWAWEWLACRAASKILLDTVAHSDYFDQTFRVDPDKTSAIFVGAEPEKFPPVEIRQTGSAPTVLFYGQFIPLHGIDTIIKAAYLARDKPINWVIIGTGQVARKIKASLKKKPLPRLQWIEWVSYEELSQHIENCTLALGIFGDTEKASRVIPNKAFQILMSGKPLITRDSPAIRELLKPDDPGVALVPPADPQALLEAVERMAAQSFPASGLHAMTATRITPKAIGQDAVHLIYGE